MPHFDDLSHFSCLFSLFSFFFGKRFLSPVSWISAATCATSSPCKTTNLSHKSNRNKEKTKTFFVTLFHRCLSFQWWARSFFFRVEVSAASLLFILSKYLKIFRANISTTTEYLKHLNCKVCDSHEIDDNNVDAGNWLFKTFRLYNAHSWSCFASTTANSN